MFTQISNYLNISNSIKLQVSRSNIINGSHFVIAVIIIIHLSMGHVLGQVSGILEISKTTSEPWSPNKTSMKVACIVLYI